MWGNGAAFSVKTGCIVQMISAECHHQSTYHFVFCNYELLVVVLITAKYVMKNERLGNSLQYKEVVS